MDPHDVLPMVRRVTTNLSRRAALRRFGGGLAAALAASGAVSHTVAAQQATPAAATLMWQRLHLEFDLTPVNGVTITHAGGGPPQRGDFFHIDAPIFAAGNVNGTEIGRYQCFGVWTHAATDTTALDQRLTTVQYRLQDGSIMGLINEGGVNQAALVGAVQGGTGRYVGAAGTFRQVPVAAGLQAVFDLILPVVS